MWIAFLILALGMLLVYLGGLEHPLANAWTFVIATPLLVAVPAGVGFFASRSIAEGFFNSRCAAMLSHLRDFGPVVFTPYRLNWTPDVPALKHSVTRPGTSVLHLLAGAAALAVAHLVMTVQMGFWERRAESGSRLFLISTYGAACALLLWFGHRSLRAMQKRTEADIIGNSTRQWEQIRSDFAPDLETLQAISREISEISAAVGLRLTEAERNVRQKSRVADTVRPSVCG